MQINVSYCLFKKCLPPLFFLSLSLSLSLPLFHSLSFSLPLSPSIVSWSLWIIIFYPFLCCSQGKKSPNRVIILGQYKNTIHTLSHNTRTHMHTTHISLLFFPSLSHFPFSPSFSLHFDFLPFSIQYLALHCKNSQWWPLIFINLIFCKQVKTAAF